MLPRQNDLRKYFDFRSQLEQSCQYYTNLARSQLLGVNHSYGYQNQYPYYNNYNHSIPVNSALGSRNYPPGGTHSYGARSVGTTNSSNTYSSYLTPLPPSQRQRQGVPSVNPGPGIYNNGYYDYSSFAPSSYVATPSANTYSTKKPKATGKVNFAYPLSVVKIQSPVPMYSLEDFTDMMQACNNIKTDWTAPKVAVAQEGMYDTLSNYSDCAEGYLYCQNGEELLSSYFQNELDNATTTRRRKRRKKRKRNNSHCLGSAIDTTDDNAYYEEGEEDLDPYETEVLPDENDYEFVSEIRLCTADVTNDDLDFEVDEDNEEDTTEDYGSDSVDNSSDPNAPTESESPDAEQDHNCYNENASAANDVSGEDENEVEADAVEEMRQLYGDTGSERIRQMEESIEADFLNEAKMLT